MDCICGAPADPFLISMCRKCFQLWTDAKTAAWLRASRRKLEAYMMKTEVL